MREPARTDSEARRRYLGHLQRSLSCVSSSAVWRYGPSPRPGIFVTLSVPPVVGLSRGSEAAALYLRATQEFHYDDHPDFPGERKVVIDAYAYTLSESAELTAELLAWHWQPEDGQGPHMHIGRAHPRLGELGRFHVPSGRVALEEVLRFAVDDLGVIPARPDAREVLDETLERFRRYRSWG